MSIGHYMTDEEIARLRALCARQIDCQDNSCRFARKRGGMRTNGGCRCVGYQLRPLTIATISETWQALPRALDEIERLQMLMRVEEHARHDALPQTDTPKGKK